VTGRRIALITEHASPLALLGSVDAGGQNVYVEQLARGLAALGHRVDVFTRRDDRAQPDVVDMAEGVRVVHLDAGPSAPVPKDELWPHIPPLAEALRRFTQRADARYDVIHGNFWMSGWIALAMREWSGAPVVELFHALGSLKKRHQGADDTSPPERIAVETRVAHEADLVIAPCPSERDELIDEYGVPEERIALCPLGVDTERFRPVARDLARARIGVPRTSKLVVYVGRVLPRKDVRNVVRAIALLRRRGDAPRLLVVGGETADPDPGRTPEIGELRRLVVEEGVSDLVTFAGKRQPDELYLYYGSADVVVTTPHYEPFGLTPLEAMACARPVIGAAVGGITYTIRNGDTGLLVPAKDPRALAVALGWLLARPDEIERMGTAGRARVERDFRWDAVARRTSEIYDRAIAERSRAHLHPLEVGGAAR
jgi:glycosyltransferase involved in cell wall biosynthesis